MSFSTFPATWYVVSATSSALRRLRGDPAPRRGAPAFFAPAGTSSLRIARMRCDSRISTVLSMLGCIPNATGDSRAGSVEAMYAK